MTDAKALSHREDIIEIYSNSWGPSDDGETVAGPGSLTRMAFEAGSKQVSACQCCTVTQLWGFQPTPLNSIRLAIATHCMCIFAYIMHSHGIIQLQGRRGKGSIWVWAAGNGGYLDTCAADGYASSIYTIAIGAANSNGAAAPYDEWCSAKMAVVLIQDQFAYRKSESERLRVVSVGN